MPIKWYSYQFRKDITTGKHNKLISIYTSSFKIEFQSFSTDYIQFSLVTQKSQYLVVFTLPYPTPGEMTFLFTQETKHTFKARSPQRCPPPKS